MPSGSAMRLRGLLPMLGEAGTRRSGDGGMRPGRAGLWNCLGFKCAPKTAVPSGK